MENYVKRQSHLTNLIANAVINMKKSGKDKITGGTITARKALIQSYFEQFQANHEAMLSNATKTELESNDYFTNDHYGVAENNYVENLGALNDMLDELTSKNVPTISQPAAQTQVFLPKIDIPHFAGDHLEWPAFRDLFTTLIYENKQLSDIQKLHYLKTNLTGEAANLLKNITITSANFATAWSVLKERYENNKVLVSANLQALMSIPKVTEESASNLKNLIDSTTQAVKALENLGRPVSHWDDWIIHITTQKLDAITRKDWETSICSKPDLPTLKELEEFLIGRVRTLEIVGSSTQNKSSSTLSNRRNAHFAGNSNVGEKTCPTCKDKHMLYICPEFRKKSVSEKRQIVLNENLCFNCLRKGHSRNNCRSTNRCRECNKEHHSLLHSPQTDSSTVNKSSPSPRKNTEATTVQTLHTSNEHCQRNVLLATARVNLKARNGTLIQFRALIDQGSEACFITETALQRLRLPKRKLQMKISGIGANHITTQGLVELDLSSCTDKMFSLRIQALVLSKLTNSLPSSYIKLQEWPALSSLELADPYYYNTSHIDLIIGAEAFPIILRDGVHKAPFDNLVAQKTSLGWIISGTTMENKTHKRDNSVRALCASHVQLEDQLRRFWEVEEIQHKTQLTTEEKICEQIFESSHFRNSDGRFTVKLPTITGEDGKLGLGKSVDIAIYRLKQQEKRFSMDPELKSLYTDFMKQYKDLGHMQQISKNEPSSSSDVCYLPHHGVFKPSSSTTKLRVVFNASQPTSSGVSLNDKLYIGPKLQNDLTSIIMRWRQHVFVFSADIEKMYRQIWIKTEDRNLQRIVWRESPDDEIEHYQLATVTYGTSSAPYLAIKCLRKLAEYEQAQYPRGSVILERETYVDDILSGAFDLTELYEAKKQLTDLLKKGGFTLKKWASNSSEFLATIPLMDQERDSTLPVDADNVVKTLGIYWTPTTDSFGFKIDIPIRNSPCTKRNMLSDIARLYDPLGWVTPVIILAKIMFQQLWLESSNWDDCLPETLEIRLKNFRDELPTLENIKIPRWIGTTSSESNIELHGFSDASELAYAAVVYIRVRHCDGSYRVHLISAKSKVAPLKTISIPRLELCGALLLARLLQKIKESMVFENTVIYAWTDSSIVLAWLKSHPSKWKPFIANRVTEIQSLLNNANWNYVPSKLNPADCASRGLTPAQLLNHHLWFNGPEWLSEDFKPRLPPTIPLDVIHVEERKSVTAAVAQSAKPWNLLEKYSSLTQLIRITAYCQRFIINCRHKIKSMECSSREDHLLDKLNLVLTVTELKKAHRFWINNVQQDSFNQEIQSLSKGQHIKSSSRLIKLNPFLDEDGLLRVGGRIENSLLTYDEKHPIILPQESIFTRLLVERSHLSTYHGGVQLTMSHLRRKYWILNERKIVRSHIFKCITCFRHAKHQNEQLMGQLPTARVRISRPFLHTGVDYAGPIKVRTGKGRGYKSTKGYIAIFVCLGIKAVHLELVGDLTTESYIAAFRRFISRRGKCSDLYSDQGTNFIGADSEFKSNLKQAMLDYKFQEMLTDDGTNWHFIPPASPHFGGLWEAAVKSLKHHLRRVIGDLTLTYEELYTVLAQVEACLNSRPIHPMSSDPDDLSILTPGHFLVGGSLISTPEPNILEENPNLLNRWQMIQKIYQDFWKTWSRDYFNQLQKRHKWNRVQPGIKVDDLVLIKEDQIPPTKWSLGRVITIHPGKDNISRVATIRCKGTTLKRPITKIAVLPINCDKTTPGPTAGGC